MKNYAVGSTSNLLEKNAAWNTLRQQVTLSFQSYGDIFSGFMAPNDTGVIVVLFLEDLVQDALDDYSSIEKSNQVFLNLVRKRIMESSEPIIICLAGRALTSAVALARNNTKLKTFHHELIVALIELQKSSSNIYFSNMDDVFYGPGSDQIFSDRNWYFGRCRLSVMGLATLANSITEIVDRISNPPKKVLVLDCDNTLWGGVIGEDGLQGLVLGQDGLGQAFVDFQKECLRISKQGILLALASKNNEGDVWNVFDNHASMILRREDIVSFRINWTEKYTNLLEIANELDLGIDSFVFWDDNPVERSKMLALLPEVLTIDAPKNVAEWPNKIRNLACFSSFELTSEDSAKSHQYKARATFINDAKQAKDINSYLNSINLAPCKVDLAESNLTRAEQMCKKTNQFNLSTKRYSSEDLVALSRDHDADVFLVGLKDDYGDHGLVALIALRSLSDNIMLIDTFLMSCRVLGRHLEAWILHQIIQLARQREIKWLLADFVDSGRNKIGRKFLDDYGFNIVSKESGVLQVVNEVDHYVPEGVLYHLSDPNAVIPNLNVFYGETDESA